MKYGHIYPENDLIEHSTGAVDDEYSCRCNPDFQYNWDEDYCLIVHESMDRREISEESPAYLEIM